jgi:hypothetical protein
MNPFPQIVALFNDEYVVVTNNILDHIGLACKHAGLFLQTRDQAFGILEYLADNNVFDIIETETKTFLIKIKQYGHQAN